MPAMPARPEARAKGGTDKLPPPLRLARQLTVEGRPDEAECLLARATRVLPDPVGPSVELARLLQSQRRYAEAEEHWRQALRQAPDDSAIAVCLLKVLRLRHRYDDAEKGIAESLARRPGERPLLLEAARLAVQREAYGEALRRHHEVLATHGPSAEILDGMASVLAAQHRFAAADAVLARLIGAEPHKTAWRVSFARVAEERGELELALRRWHEVLEIDGAHLKARIAIAGLLEAFGHLNEAENSYRDLAETHPDSPEPYYRLGRMALDQSELGAAVTWLERALALNPDDWASKAALVRAVAEQHRFDRARSMARDLLTARPDHLDTHLLLAEAEERAGRLRAAEQTLRRACISFPQAFQPALKRAAFLTRLGRATEARDVLEAASQQNPDTFSLNLARVDACFALNDLDAAGRLAEPLREAYPEHRDVNRRIARLEAAHGRYGPARRIWREIARTDRRVAGPPLNLERLDDRPIPPSGDEIRLFSRIRSEHLRLPWLLDFYRSQGVDRFFFVDNGSDDGSRDYLLSRPDTHLFLTTDSYAVYGGGMRWLNHLLNRYGSGGWCLTVDVDEVLAYPHAEQVGLKALTRHLEASGAQAMFGFMLDMYADASLHEVGYRAGDNPLDVCPFFDREGYIVRDQPDFPFRMVVGGLVSRFFYDGKQDGVYLHKVPLVRWEEGLNYTSSTHTLFPLPLAEETGVLLHLKYMADFIDRAKIEAQRKQYWRGAKRYTVFNRRFETDAAIDFRCPLTERFRSTAQLTALGLMRSSPELDALAREPGSGPRLPGWPSPDDTLPHEAG